MHPYNFPVSPSPPPLWHMIFDLSALPDRAEVWPSERRGAEAVDPGHHWSLHRRRLPERVEERSCSLRVRSAAALGATEMSHAVTVEPFWFALKTLPSAPLSWLPFSLEKCPTPPHPPSRRSTVVFMGLKSIFLFLSGLLTIWPQALWKRSTIPFSTGIRWVSGHLLSAEVFGQCLFVFFGGFFHSRWFKLGEGGRPTFSGSLKVFGYKISCNYYRFLYSLEIWHNQNWCFLPETAFTCSQLLLVCCQFRVLPARTLIYLYVF